MALAHLRATLDVRLRLHHLCGSSSSFKIPSQASKGCSRLTKTISPCQTLFMPETYPPTILLRRAKRLRKLTGNDLIKTRWELEHPEGMSVLKMGLNQIKMAFVLCGEPAVFYSNVYIGLLCESSLPLSSLRSYTAHARTTQRRDILSLVRIFSDRVRPISRLQPRRFAIALPRVPGHGRTHAPRYVLCVRMFPPISPADLYLFSS